MSQSSFSAAFFHLFKAIKYSLCGLKAGVRLSLSFRQEIFVLLPLCAALAFFGKSGGQWLVCLGAWGLVMVAELLNTAIEETLNLITRDFSPQVRDAKDMGSAAVFLLLLLNGCLWIYMFGRDILALWRHFFA